MFLEIFGNTDPQIVNRAFEETLRKLEELAKVPENSFLKSMSFYPGAENLLSQEFLNALFGHQAAHKTDHLIVG